MRDALQKWAYAYPRNPGWRDGSFTGAPEKDIVETDVPRALQDILRDDGRYSIEGSAGQGDWTKTPWVSVLDRAVTTSTQEGFYLVYLLSHGCERLYLVLGQGCTRLKDESGIPETRQELRRRAELMRKRIKGDLGRLRQIEMDLNASGWRADLYEASVVVGAVYDTAKLPENDELISDFKESIRLYRMLARRGGWDADDTIAQDADEDGMKGSLDYQKSYRLHRRAERNAKHSSEVKKRHKPECAACGKTTADFYNLGRVEDGNTVSILEAHHLCPLFRIADGDNVTFDIMRDFALLCPNCHRMIHKIGAEKLDELRSLVRR
ncbi:MrcB family domain-containing protein [Maricaulis parjimensis]|uniref:MrcB family domain-containing protein n=1 Tax=Maricaulis parjimensis TaxID=144023 RepID=UPI0019399A92|nr:DUF3578 domain-containing protein [Maricaulis parjimensis]